MVQRSSTFVLNGDDFAKATARTYNERFPTDLADKLGNTTPYAVTRLIVMEGIRKAADDQPERYDDLERAGFKVERHGDVIWHVYERMGGHYVDVGASAKIAKGLIKVKSDSQITHFTTDGLGFSDGTELPADLIVFATGFEGNMRDDVRRYFGDDIADCIDDFWGFDSEGEVRGVWKFQRG